MKELITQLAQKYHFDSISSRILELDNAPTIRIGFIGEFSAGKSSLINSILDIHLPTNIAPTTKAICLIEPTFGLEKNVYFKEEGGQRSQIDFSEFRDILRGTQECHAAVVQVPPCEVLPTGCVFVDTPGIHTATGTEAELTKAYLSMLDAAVVCINITNGVINKDLLEFLCDVQLKHLQQHLVFALTWSDRKSPEECERVRAHIVKLLEQTVQQGRLELNGIHEKVFPISALESGNAKKLYDILKNAVLEDLPALHEQRKAKILQEIGKDLLNLLEMRISTMEFNSSELDAEAEKVQKEIKALQLEIRKREEKMDSFADDLTQKLRGLLSTQLLPMANVTDEQTRSTMIENMNNSISAMLQNEAKNYLGITTFNSSELGNMGIEIANRLQQIEAYKNMAVTVSTAVATAWICPGGALLGNAAQATAGAAVRGAAVSAAKASLATTGTFPKILGGIGSAISAINPLEHIGTMIAASAKKNALENMVNEKAACISMSFLSSLETPFQNEVLQPLQDNQEEKRKQLDDLQTKSMNEFEEFRTQKEQIQQDARQLKSALG